MDRPVGPGRSAPPLLPGTAVPPLDLKERRDGPDHRRSTATCHRRVDTHLDVHVAAALDPIGGVLGVESFPTTPKGYRSLVTWLGSFGPIAKVGVEGTGAYGAGLARFLRTSGIEVIEVSRPRSTALGSTPQRSSSPSPATTQNASTQKRPSPGSAESPPCRQDRARPAAAIDSAAAGTARPTRRCGAS